VIFVNINVYILLVHACKRKLRRRKLDSAGSGYISEGKFNEHYDKTQD
jgi:hypothetical protein